MLCNTPQRYGFDLRGSQWLLATEVDKVVARSCPGRKAAFQPCAPYESLASPVDLLWLSGICHLHRPHVAHDRDCHCAEDAHRH